MAENPWCHLDAPDLDRLDLASVLVHETLDTPYLVGSCLNRSDYRDVDIRVILFDDRYDELFHKPPGHRDALRHLLQVAITEHYVRATGLRIDFQIQRMTQANEQHKGRRHPLGNDGVRILRHRYYDPDTEQVIPKDSPATAAQRIAADQRAKQELIDLMEKVGGVDAWNALRWIVDRDMDLVREALQEQGFDA